LNIDPSGIPLAKIVILSLLVVLGIGFGFAWYLSLRSKLAEGLRPTPFQLLVGFITDFLDTLGIGSFATTTSFYRINRCVADDKLPGTLNVGHTLPTILQALIYINTIAIDLWTLWLLILASARLTRLPRYLKMILKPTI
jgi:hypothetical protein